MNNQGPPDLEEFFKKAFSKIIPQRRPSLKDLQPPSKKGLSSWWAIVPFVAVASFLMSGIITVKPGEEVVVTRLGIYQDTLMPGTHWVIPLIDSATSVNMQDSQQVAISGLMLTQDQYLVNANVVLNYTITDPKAYLFSAENLNSVLQAYLQAAAVQGMQKQMIANLLNKDNFAQVATSIQNGLNFDTHAYGIQIQNVSINSIGVPDALSGQFTQTINQAQNQVKSMMQAAEAYKTAIAPIATQKAGELQQVASLQRAAIIVAAKANAAEFNALLPVYQKDPAATAAYLPLTLTPTVTSLAPATQQSTTTTSTPVSSTSAQNAYARWQAANQS